MHSYRLCTSLKLFFLASLTCLAVNTKANTETLESLVEEVRKLTGEVELLRHQIALMSKQIGAENVSNIKLEPDSLTTETATSSEIQPTDSMQQYEAALATFKAKKYAEAQKLFKKLLLQSPEHPAYDKVLFWHAESLFQQKMFKEAALYYLQYYKKYPKSPKTPEALVKVATSLGALGKKDEACKVIKKLNQEFPSQTRSAHINKMYNDLKFQYGCSE